MCHSNEIAAARATLTALRIMKSRALRLALAALLAMPLAGVAAQHNPALPPLDAGTVLLVVAPHPDDETLCCAGVIQAVLRAGGHVQVLWVTSGDGSWLGAWFIEKRPWRDPAHMRAYGEARMREARRASAALGVARENGRFLGFPDGGILPLVTGAPDARYRSGATGADAVPYPDALFPGQPYTGANLAADLGALLGELRPTLVLAPTPLDAHPDHRAVGLAIIAAARGRVGVLRFWIVHGGEGWPQPRALSPGIPLPPAPRAAVLDMVPFELTPAAEDRKLEALRAYATQLRVLEPFLVSFVRTTELFATEPGGR